MRKYASYMMIVGLVGGLFMWSCVGCVELVQDAFAAGGFMGWATLFCLGILVTGFCYLCFSELSGYYSIRRVDRLAGALGGTDVLRAKRLATQWMSAIDADAKDMENAQTVQEIRQLVTSQLTELDSKIDKVIAKESIMIAAFVGISPWPMIDGAIVAWRQLRMMRGVASQYGVRPSTFGTMKLLRRVLISVVLADVSEHATQWIASKVPSMGGLIPAAGQSLAVLVLTSRVGKACKVACRPIPRSAKQSFSPLAKLKGFFRKSVLQYKKHDYQTTAGGRS
jgi:putative membrane protein